MSGYDAEVGKLVAASMGVEPCFVVAAWEQIIAGGWGDRWDVAWGSGALTADRMKSPVHDPALLLDARELLRARRFDVQDAGRPVRQEDRRVRGLHP